MSWVSSRTSRATSARRTAWLDAAARQKAPGPGLRQLVATWHAQLEGVLEDPAQRRKALLQVTKRKPDALGQNDWARVRALLDADIGSNDLQIVRDLAKTDLDLLVKAGIEGADMNASIRDAYLRAWRHELDGTLANPKRLRARIRAVLERNVSELTRADWAELEVLSSAGQRPLGLVSGVSGDSVRALFREYQTGTSTAGPKARRIFEFWKARLDGLHDDPDRLRTALLEQTGAPLSTVTPHDWSRISALMDVDAGRNALQLPRASPNPQWTLTQTIRALEKGDIKDHAYWAGRTLGRIHAALGGGYAVPELVAMRDGALAPHLIRRADVADFLEGSAWQHTTFHGNTNATTHKHVIEEGVRVEKNKRSTWGRGYYTALEPGGWGDDVVEVAIRTRNPLLTTVDECEAALAAARTATGKSESRDALLELGYDSIMLRRPEKEGGDWLIGLRNEDMRIVVEDSPSVPDRRPPGPTRFTEKVTG